MGANIETGLLETLTGKEARKLFEDHFHRRIDEILPREIDAEARERRHDEGPPIFREGELIEIRGARFRIQSMAADELILRPVKG